MSIRGWLSKKGAINKAFKQRWFVLEGSKLSYFMDDVAEKERGVITISNAVITVL